MRSGRHTMDSHCERCEINSRFCGGAVASQSTWKCGASGARFSVLLPKSETVGTGKTTHGRLQRHFGSSFRLAASLICEHSQVYHHLPSMASVMERVELAEVGGEASGSEQFLVQDARARRSPWRAAGGAGVAVLLLAGAGAGAARLALRRAASDTDRLQSKVQTVALPPRDKCAASSEDCFSLGCCNVAGLNCFETKKGKGKCLKNS